MSIVIAVPLIVVAAVIAIVFAVKLNSQTTNADTKAFEPRTYPGLSAGGTKPGSGYGGLGASSGSSPSSTDANVNPITSDLSSQLNATQDDGGASDVNAIKKDESSL